MKIILGSLVFSWGTLQVAHILNIMVPEVVEKVADYISRSVPNLSFLIMAWKREKRCRIGLLKF